ncbi:hypothetical protein Pfo_001256 [Paulownia fortunei]|nr:hypothetical protein Pfo_001256 [Paulownia fortunei]
MSSPEVFFPFPLEYSFPLSFRPSQLTNHAILSSTFKFQRKQTNSATRTPRVQDTVPFYRKFQGIRKFANSTIPGFFARNIISPCPVIVHGYGLLHLDIKHDYFILSMQTERFLVSC